MSEENLPPIPAQVEPQEKPMSNVLGIFAIVTTLFCYPIGIILSIIGLCKYRKGSAGRVLSWIGLVVFLLITACAIGIGVMVGKASREIQQKLHEHHPELNEQQILEYINDPDNKDEIWQCMQESSFIFRFIDPAGARQGE